MHAIGEPLYSIFYLHSSLSYSLQVNYNEFARMWRFGNCQLFSGLARSVGRLAGTMRAPQWNPRAPFLSPLTPRLSISIAHLTYFSLLPSDAPPPWASLLSPHHPSPHPCLPLLPPSSALHLARRLLCGKGAAENACVLCPRMANPRGSSFLSYFLFPITSFPFLMQLFSIFSIAFLLYSFSLFSLIRRTSQSASFSCFTCASLCTPLFPLLFSSLNRMHLIHGFLKRLATGGWVGGGGRGNIWVDIQTYLRFTYFESSLSFSFWLNLHRKHWRSSRARTLQIFFS